MNEWIKLEDVAPRDGQKVIYYFFHTGVSRGHYHDLEGTEDEKFGKHCFSGNGFLIDDVTHWMPDDGREELPEEPKG